MNSKKLYNFLKPINEYTETEKNKTLYEFFKNEKKFLLWKRLLDLPENLKFGLEIEVASLPLETIELLFESNSIEEIMRILGVPTDVAEKIIKYSEFGKKSMPNKWIFSKESGLEESEASSPILQNKLNDLNQVVAICTLLEALDAKLNGGTGLHINIGVDFLECNEKAIENLLKIWGECEELFYKMANPEGEEIRVVAQNMAAPIKENIQNFFEDDGSVILNTEEDMERFLYKIQARDRMKDVILPYSNLGLEFEYYCARTEEQKFHIYQLYERGIKERRENNDSRVRWTSINFNHMKWNTDNPGRIEIRIFNSSLDPEIIFQDLVLIGRVFYVCLENAKNPEFKKQEFQELLSHNVSEERKVNNLLNLLFDDEEQKKIFFKRWKSVRGIRDYEKFKSGKDTFGR